MLEVSVAKRQNEAIDYVAVRTGTTPANMQPAIGAALLKDGKMAGAVVFNNYHVLHKGSWCEISVAIDDAECVSKRTAYGRFSSIRSSNSECLAIAGCKRRLRTRGVGRSSSAWASS